VPPTFRGVKPVRGRFGACARSPGAANCVLPAHFRQRQSSRHASTCEGPVRALRLRESSYKPCRICHGVPYVAAETGVPSSSSAATMSETRPALPNRTSCHIHGGSRDAQPFGRHYAERDAAVATGASKSARMWRSGSRDRVGSLLVTLSIVSIVRYAAEAGQHRPGSRSLIRSWCWSSDRHQLRGRQVAALPNTAVNPTKTKGPESAEPPPPAPSPASESASRSPPAPCPSPHRRPRPRRIRIQLCAPSPPASSVASAPALKGSRDLTGMWTGAYLDGSGRAQLEVVEPAERQVTDGAITGPLHLQSGQHGRRRMHAGKKHPTRRRANACALIVHCRQPESPEVFERAAGVHRRGPARELTSRGRATSLPSRRRHRRELKRTKGV